MPEQVGIEIVATDKASNVLKRVGSAGEKALGKSGMGGAIKALPEQFGKASTAMLLFQNSTSQMGGRVADAANKLTAVVGLVATGGPIGVGLAAMTLAISFGSKAWEKYNESTRLAEEALRAMEEQTRRTKESVVELEQQLEDFGKTSLQAEIDRLQKEIEVKEKSVKADEAMLKASKDLVKGRGEIIAVGDEINEQIAVNRTISETQLAGQRLQVEQDKQRLRMLLELSEKTRLKSEADDKEREAEKRKADRIRDTEKARRKNIRAIIDEIKAIKERAMAELETRQISVDQFVAMRAKANEMQLQLDEALARSQDALVTRSVQRQDQLYAGLAMTVGDIYSSMIEDSDNAGKHMVQGILSIAEKTILARALETGAGAGSAVASIPIIGPALVPAAIAASFAVVKALINQLPGFALGGVVQGGAPNRDSVLAALTPGERVLNQRERREYEAGSRSTTGGARSVSLTVVAPVQNPQEMTRAQMRRWVYAIAPALEEAVADGSLLRELKRA